MEHYKEMYLLLFNKLTDVIGELTRLKDTLVETQQAAEEHFMSREE